MPTVVSLLVRTIAFDFTNLQTLNAKIRFLKVFILGLAFETTLKFLISNFLSSGV